MRSLTSMIKAVKDKPADNIDYVSPYTIFNDTGYDIEVCEDMGEQKLDD